ncbi:MAG: Nif11-like leader peptide family natural product precursor [Clostridia bacterium]|nr:Nif11-like leader peptide family natural product precursor [Clostridia bacterium]
MKSLAEFKTRIQGDKAFASKFVGIENESQVIALARAEGYDLEQLSDEELDNVSAAGWWNDLKEGIKEFFKSGIHR